MKKNLVKFISVVSVGMMCGMPSVFAKTTKVNAGATTLKTAIENADVGDTLRLTGGTYGNEGTQIIINKDLTIEGEGSTINSEIIIDDEDDTPNNVVIKNIRAVPITKNLNWNYVKVNKKVNLTLEKVTFLTIGRGDNLNKGVYQTVLNIDGANGSKIDINNSMFSILYDGIRLAASDVEINIYNNSYISGQKAFDILNGENNTINVNDSNISARSSLHENEEAISIENEKGLTINLNNTIVTGNDSKSPNAEYIFSLDGETPCSNIKLNITGNSKIVDENNAPGSAIFNFGKSNTADNSNVIYIENGVDIILSKNNKESLITVPYKYNVDADYVVVGIYDNEGNLTVKAYDKNAKINQKELPSEKEGYRLKGYQFIDDDTNEKKEFNVETELTKNMDIYSNYVKLYNVTIDGVEGNFEVEENTKFKDFKATEAVKDKISALESVDTKKFVGFKDQDDEEIDDDYIFNKDVTITAKYQVEIKIGEETFTFDEGKTLNSNSRILEIVEGYDNDKTKHYAGLVDEGGVGVPLTEELHQNMTLKPKYGISVEIGDDVFFFEEQGHKLGDLTNEDKVKLENYKKADNKTFKHFEDANGDTVDMETVFDENAVLTPKFTINVKINDVEDITLDEGQSLSNIDTLSTYKTKAGLKFMRFEDANGETINERDPLHENIQLTAIFAYEITIDSKIYDLEEGKKLEDSEEIMNALETLKDSEKDFSRFVDVDKNTVNTNEVITKNLTISALYNINVEIGENIYKIEEGKMLSEDTELKSALDALKDVVKKNFKKYVINSVEYDSLDDYVASEDISIVATYTITITITDKGEFTLDEGNSLSSSADIMAIIDEYKNDGTRHFADLIDENGIGIPVDMELHENMTLSPKYGMSIQIGEEVFFFDDLNHRLNEILLREDTDEDKIRLNSIINPGNKDFSYFEASGNKYYIDTEFSENAVLTPKYTINVTINGENKTLDEGQFLSDIEDLSNFKTKDGRKFLRFEDEDGNVVSEDSPLKEHINLKAIFGVTVTIENTGDKFDLAEGNDATQNLELYQALDDLMYNGDFSRFVDLDGNTITTATPITDNITIKALYFKTVMVEDEEYQIEEGKKLNDEKDIVDALNELKNVSNKVFKEYVVDGVINNEIDFETVVNDDMNIKANYSIRISIDGIEQLLDEGQSLSDLANLSNFKIKEDRKFLKFEDLDGNTVLETTVLNENVDLKSIFTLEVTINDKVYDLIEGKSLESNESIKNALEALKKNRKEFSRFVDLDGNTVEVNTNINEPLTIKALYKNSVTVGDESFKLEEGKKLSDDKDIVNALNKLKEATNKQFKEFVVDNKVVEDLDYDMIVNDDIVVKANYKIIVKLNEHEFVLDENSKLSDLSSEELSLIEKIMKEERFVRFVDEDGNTILLDTVLNENKNLSIKHYIIVTIGDEEFKLEEGQSLSDLNDEDKQRLEKLMEHDETKEFKGFKNIKNEEEITLDTKLNEDINLEVILSDVVVENEEVDNNVSNPQTVDNIMTYVMMAVISLIVLVFGIKNSLKKLNK